VSLLGSNYAALIAEGNLALGKNLFKEALKIFIKASNMSEGNNKQAEAVQLIGIASRLNGDYRRSEEAFKRALVHTNDPMIKAKIQRDLGMTYLDKANSIKRNQPYRHAEIETLYKKAEERFSNSIYAMRCPHEELGMSRSFMARLHFSKNDKESARSDFERAHDEIKGKNDTYELNNLIWLARSSIICRWIYAWRAIQLAVKTGASRRWKEYLIILVGGNLLYEKIAAKVRP